MQLGGPFAIYYQATALLGAWATSRSAQVGAVLWNSAIGEVTFFDLFMIGAGPSLDFVAGCGVDAISVITPCLEGSAFGIDGRVALAIGGRGPGRRSGFLVGADIHPMFVTQTGGAVTAFVITITGGPY